MADSDAWRDVDMEPAYFPVLELESEVSSALSQRGIQSQNSEGVFSFTDSEKGVLTFHKGVI